MNGVIVTVDDADADVEITSEAARPEVVAILLAAARAAGSVRLVRTTTHHARTGYRAPASVAAELFTGTTKKPRRRVAGVAR